MVACGPQNPLVHLTSTSCKRLVTLATGNLSYKVLFSLLFISFDISIWSGSASPICGKSLSTQVYYGPSSRRMTTGAESYVPRGNGKIEQNSAFFHRLVETTP